MRRTSVFAAGENLGAGGIHFRRAFEVKGGGGLWPPEPKKKDSLAAVLLFGDPSGIRTPDPLLKRQLLCRLS